MSETAVPRCIRGCTFRESHAVTCSCSEDGHEHVVAVHPHTATETCDDDCRWCDDCRGCAPRPAEVGHLCQPCHGRVVRALRGSADLVEWVREHIVPGTRRPGRSDVLREAPAPLELTAVDDADSIHAILAQWVVICCEATGLRGPSWQGSAVRPMSKRRQRGFHASTCPDDGTCSGCAVQYDAARVVGLRPSAFASMATGRLADWLVTHAQDIAGLPAADAWHDEVVDAYGAANARWPREDRAKKLPLPCPSCERVLLFMHPPAEEGHPVTVVCHRDECGRILTDADYYLKAQEALYERTGKAVAR